MKTADQLNTDFLQVEHNIQDRRFEVRIDSRYAKLLYNFQGDTIVFTHTAVPGTWRGHDVGIMLVRAGLDFARTKGFKVIPVCPFVLEYISKTPEYQDLLE